MESSPVSQPLSPLPPKVLDWQAASRDIGPVSSSDAAVGLLSRAERLKAIETAVQADWLRNESLFLCRVLNQWRDQASFLVLLSILCLLEIVIVAAQ